MLLKENAVYKHACVRCYQLYTIPRNSLIPIAHSLLTHFKKLETLRKKIIIQVLLKRNFILFLLFGLWKHPVIETTTSLRAFVCLLELIQGENASLLYPVWTSHFSLGPVSHPPTCAVGGTWLCLARNLCAGTGKPLLGSPSPALSQPSAAASPHRAAVPALTNPITQIWTHYSSQILIYIKVTTNDPVKAGQ